MKMNRHFKQSRYQHFLLTPFLQETNYDYYHHLDWFGSRRCHCCCNQEIVRRLTLQPERTWKHGTDSYHNRRHPSCNHRSARRLSPPQHKIKPKLLTERNVIWPFLFHGALLPLPGQLLPLPSKKSKTDLMTKTLKHSKQRKRTHHETF